MNREVIIRVDGNIILGLGHLIRCIALANMLKDYFNIKFVCKDIPEKIKKILSDSHFSIQIIVEESEFFSIIKSKNIIVLDGYQFDTDYQKIVKSKECKLVCIDDMHYYKFSCDLIINHGPNEKKENYFTEKLTKFALGHEFLLLREEFLNEMPNIQMVNEVKNLLIILGGTDIKGLSLELLQNNIDSGFQHVHIISGASNIYFKQLTKLAKDKSKVSIHHNLNAREIVSLSRNCDICICSPSGVAYEMACIGIGLVLCMIADNQIHFYNFFIKNQLAVGLSFLDKYGTKIEELMKLVTLVRTDNAMVNIQIQNQKKLFKDNPKQNIINQFNAL